MVVTKDLFPQISLIGNGLILLWLSFVLKGAVKFPTTGPNFFSDTLQAPYLAGVVGCKGLLRISLCQASPTYARCSTGWKMPPCSCPVMSILQIHLLQLSRLQESFPGLPLLSLSHTQPLAHCLGVFTWLHATTELCSFLWRTQFVIIHLLGSVFLTRK